MRFRRLVTIMLTLSVVASLMALPVAAIDYSDVVAPLYIGLEDVTADLAISSNGYANCSGSAYVANGYNATVVMELQQKNGAWKPIKRWSKSGGYSLLPRCRPSHPLRLRQCPLWSGRQGRPWQPPASRP